MTLASAAIESAAEKLHTAEQTVEAIEPLTDEWPEMTIEEAYAVQMVNVRRRLAEGAQVKGHKIGFTAKAMQRQLGVDVPDYGHLFDDMFVFEEEEISTDGLLEPRVEPEIAFVLRDRLAGPGLTVADVVRATDYIVPALEIIDSRVAEWRIKIQDTIADNASAARVVLGGRPVDPRAHDLAHLPAILRRNGAIEDTATGAAVLGNPISAVAWLANALADYGVELDPGHVVLSGSFCSSVFAHPGDGISASFGPLGIVTARFSG